MDLTAIDLVLGRAHRHFRYLATGQDKGAAFGHYTLAHSAYRALRESDLKTADDCSDCAAQIRAAAPEDQIMAERWLNTVTHECNTFIEPTEVHLQRWIWMLSLALERLITCSRRNVFASVPHYERYIPDPALAA